MKPTKRKAFSFLRSYFDALNEIPDKEDKYNFLMSVINKQFLDEDPENLTLIAKLSYEGQRHAIEKSVKGYKDKMKTDLQGNPLKQPKQDPCQGCYKPPKQDPLQQEKEKGKEQVKEKLTNIDVESRIDAVFLQYREKYKIYANQLYNDNIFIESISREFLKNTKPEICKATIKKYLGLFLNRLDQDKKIHNNKGEFQSHFPSWMRKQPSIEKVQPKKEKIRYF